MMSREFQNQRQADLLEPNRRVEVAESPFHKNPGLSPIHDLSPIEKVYDINDKKK